MRIVVLVGCWWVLGCGFSEAGNTGGGGGSAGGTGAAGGGGGTAQPQACGCFFERWSLETGCGTFCLGNDRLTCTASAARIDPDGCAVGGASDAGVSSDAGTPLVLDAGAALDAGTLDCTPYATECGCTIAPYGTEGFRLTIPCCSTLCVPSVKRAWFCSSMGQSSPTGLPAVCGG